MPTVSVIMPAYNSQYYIGEAIGSVLNQTYKDLEIIVVDDGSTDGTAEVVKKYIETVDRRPKIEDRKQKPSIKYIYQENRGPAAARNRGIKESIGDYIAFLDSDDIWLPEKLALQVKRLEYDPECCLVHANRVRIGLSGDEMPTKYGKAMEGQVFNQLLNENTICSSSVMVRKACLSDIGLFDEDRNNRSEDYDLWLRIAHKHRIGFIDQVMVKYRVNPIGYNRSNIKSAYDSEEKVFLKALNKYDGDKEMLKRDRLHKLNSKMGNSLFYVKEYAQASRAFASAFKIVHTDIRSAGLYVISKCMEALKA